MVNLGNKIYFETRMGKLENKNESHHQYTGWVQINQNCSQQRTE
jgi:hypothetical protein